MICEHGVYIIDRCDLCDKEKIERIEKLESLLAKIYTLYGSRFPKKILDEITETVGE